MNRRVFVTSLAAVLATPLAAKAQPSRSVVVGFLSSGSQSIARDFVAAFGHGLSESGYVDGQNVRIEYRWADGHYDRLPVLVTDLINRNAAVIVAGGPPAAVAAKAATSALPIVFIASDAVPLGLVASLNRPGGNVTGVSILATSLWPKRLELMSELLPTVVPMAMLVNPRSKEEPTGAEVQQTAHKFGRQLSIIAASTESEIDAAFSAVVQQHVGAILVSPDPLFTSRSDQIVRLAARHSLPAMYGWRQHVAAGGLISYGASLTDAWHRAGAYTGRILKGAKPADLPVEQPTKFELVINLKTAKALSLTIPPSLLLRADQIIE
jgi:putative tryptophan/tyrosine transport system substrate-binding protein